MSIIRHHTNQRMSQIVIHGDTIYLAGQVADDPEADIKAQTRQVLKKVEALLAASTPWTVTCAIGFRSRR